MQNTVLELSTQKTDTEIDYLLTPEEHEHFDRTLNSRLVTKFLVENEGEKINVRDLVGKSTFKINGRDARALAGNGGALTMFHHMDAILTELRLKNREALDFHVDRVSSRDLQLQSSEAEILLNSLSRKVAKLCDMEPQQLKHDESKVSDKINELNEILEELAEYDNEVHTHQKNIIALGQEAYKLYSTDTVLERDDTCAKIMNIYILFQNLYRPVLYPCSDKKEELLADLDGMETNGKLFLEALNKSNLNLDFKAHSYYMHWLLYEAERDCRFVINTLGVHISKLNEQTSEHMNKVLKAILVRLQGFTNRAVGNSASGDNLFNKMGFVINENHIHNFYHFLTICPKKKGPTCGICGQTGHYQRSCNLPCTVCGAFYYKGHHKSICVFSCVRGSPLYK